MTEYIKLRMQDEDTGKFLYFTEVEITTRYGDYIAIHPVLPPTYHQKYIVSHIPTGAAFAKNLKLRQAQLFGRFLQRSLPEDILKIRGHIKFPRVSKKYLESKGLLEKLRRFVKAGRENAGV